MAKSNKELEAQATQALDALKSLVWMLSIGMDADIVAKLWLRAHLQYFRWALITIKHALYLVSQSCHSLLPLSFSAAAGEVPHE